MYGPVIVKYFKFLVTATLFYEHSPKVGFAIKR